MSIRVRGGDVGICILYMNQQQGQRHCCLQLSSRSMCSLFIIHPSSFLSFFFLYYSSNLINYNYFISTQRNKFKSRNTILMNFQLNAIKYRTYSCLSVLFLWNTLLLLCISTFRSLFSE